MLTPAKERGAAQRPNLAAPSQTKQPDAEAGGQRKHTPDGDLLATLRLQLARHGLQLSQTCGTELVLTGPGLSHLAPDLRSAWLLVRCLNGGRA